MIACDKRSRIFVLIARRFNNDVLFSFSVFREGTGCSEFTHGITIDDYQYVRGTLDC